MFASIRNRMLVIAGLIALSLFYLFPRDVKVRLAKEIVANAPGADPQAVVRAAEAAERAGR